MPTPTLAASPARHEALQVALRENQGRLHALAFRLLGDHHAAEDAVQDACLRALQAVNRFRGDASMATWLYRITQNRCLDELRRRRPVVFDTTSDEAVGLLVEADFAETAVERDFLAEALAGLPVTQREAVVATLVWGLDYADAGAVLGVPAGTLGSRLHRAKLAMRAALGPVRRPPEEGPALERAA